MTGPVIEMDDEQLDAIANDYITEAEIGSTLLHAALSDRDWPYVVALILMNRSYMELSDHPNMQAFIRNTSKDWGEDHTHEHWSSLDLSGSYEIAKRVAFAYNKTKGEK